MEVFRYSIHHLLSYLPACLPACVPFCLWHYTTPTPQSYECVTAVTQRLEKMGIAGHQTTAGAERKVDRASSLMAALTRKVGRQASSRATSRLARDRFRQADSPAYALLERVRCLRWRSVGWQGSTETQEKKIYIPACGCCSSMIPLFTYGVVGLAVSISGVVGRVTMGIAKRE